MPRFSNFTPSSSFATDALLRCEEVTNDLVDILGNLGAIVAIDVEGVGRVTFTAGHSDLEKLRAVQPTDRYAIGSQTKTVVAMTILLMSRDGLLGLDDPLYKYVDLPVDRRITIRHLLMNSCGLGEVVNALVAARADLRIHYAPRDLIALVLPQGQLFPPGSYFDYCNTGWVILGMIIEAISGKRMSDVIAQRILSPLELKNSGFGGSMPSGEFLRCYISFDKEEPTDTTQLLSWAFGAGDGFSNADDILTIFKSLTRVDSPLGISLHDLGHRTLRSTSSPATRLSVGAEYGFGIERRKWAGNEVWGHPGSTFACRSSTWVDTKRGVAVTMALTIHLENALQDDTARFPRGQLFSMALNTGYALAADRV